MTPTEHSGADGLGVDRDSSEESERSADASTANASSGDRVSATDSATGSDSTNATASDSTTANGATASGSDGAAPPAAEPLRVLNLVTNDRARFFTQQVAALEDRGVEFRTIAVPKDHDPGSSRSVLDYAKIVPPTIRASFGDYDFVHANSGLTVPAAIAQPSLPVLVSLWGSDLLGRYGPVTRRTVRFADEVVVMSDEMAEALPSEPIVIPHGVDLERFAPMDQAAALAEVGWADDRRHVLFPYDTDRPVKNYPRAERIVDAAREHTDVTLELQSISGVPHERVATYMNAADVLVLSSHREGSPNAVKEAMACSLPVAATPVGDVAERLDGVSPSVVASDDADLARGIASIVEEAERSDGRERVAAECSVDAMADRLYEVYRSLAADAR